MGGLGVWHEWKEGKFPTPAKYPPDSLEDSPDAAGRDGSSEIIEDDAVPVDGLLSAVVLALCTCVTELTLPTLGWILHYT